VAVVVIVYEIGGGAAHAPTLRRGRAQAPVSRLVIGDTNGRCAARLDRTAPIKTPEGVPMSHLRWISLVPFLLASACSPAPVEPTADSLTSPTAPGATTNLARATNRKTWSSTLTAAPGATESAQPQSVASPRPFDSAPSVLPTSHIVEVDWGNVNGMVTEYMPQFYSDFAKSGYMHSLQEYGAGASSSFLGAYPMPFSVPSSTSFGEIMGDLASAISSNSVPQPDCQPPSPFGGIDVYTDYIYAVHLPPGLVVTDLGQSCKGWCGYHHSAFYTKQNGTTSFYRCNFTWLVMPDYGVGSGCDTACRYTNGGMINSFTKAASHELIETLTDPYTSGVTVNGQEIGDLCNGDLNYPTPVDGGNGFTFMAASNGPPWFVQSPYSSAQNSCVLNASWSWDSAMYKSSGLATVRTPEHLDIFSTAAANEKTPSGTIVSSYWDYVHPWTQIPAVGSNSGIAPANAPVAAIARKQNQIDIFVVDNNSQIETSWWDGNWHPFYTIKPTNGTYSVQPGTLVAAVSRYPEHIDLFFANSSGNLVTLWWDVSTNVWSQTLLGNPNVVSPQARVTALSRSPDQLDVFAADQNGAVQIASWNANSGWQGPGPIPGSQVHPGTQIAAVARWPWHIDIFASGNDGSVQSYWWDANVNNGNWNTVAGGVMPSGTTYAGAGVAAALQGSSKIDVFATQSSFVGTTNLVGTWWDDAVGGSWQKHLYTVPGRQIWTPGELLHAVSRYRGEVDIFGLQGDGSVLTTYWKLASGWSTPAIRLRP
jgi:hypothetical protein